MTAGAHDPACRLPPSRGDGVPGSLERPGTASGVALDVGDAALRPLGSRVFAAEPAQAGVARRWLAARLGAGHPARDDCVLLLSETFTNGVRYSHGDPIQITAFGNAHTVHIEVTDGGGDTLPHHNQHPDEQGLENGRGLPVIQALASDWGYQVLQHDRLRVWFTIDDHHKNPDQTGT